MDKFSSSPKPKNQNKKDEKGLILMNANELLQRRQILINAFKNGIVSTHSRASPSSRDNDFDRILTSEPQSTSSPLKQTQEKGIKKLLPKQILQRLPIMLTQVKAGNSYEKLLNEIRQIFNSFYRDKTTQKVEIYLLKLI